MYFLVFLGKKDKKTQQFVSHFHSGSIFDYGDLCVRDFLHRVRQIICPSFSMRAFGDLPLVTKACEERSWKYKSDPVEKLLHCKEPLPAFVLTAWWKKMMFNPPVRDGSPSNPLLPRSIGCMGPFLSCSGCRCNAIRRRGCTQADSGGRSRRR